MSDEQAYQTLKISDSTPKLPDVVWVYVMFLYSNTYSHVERLFHGPNLDL